MALPVGVLTTAFAGHQLEHAQGRSRLGLHRRLRRCVFDVSGRPRRLPLTHQQGQCFEGQLATRGASGQTINPVEPPLGHSLQCRIQSAQGFPETCRSLNA